MSLMMVDASPLAMIKELIQVLTKKSFTTSFIWRAHPIKAICSVVVGATSSPIPYVFIGWAVIGWFSAILFYIALPSWLPTHCTVGEKFTLRATTEPSVTLGTRNKLTHSCITAMVGTLLCSATVTWLIPLSDTISTARHRYRVEGFVEEAVIIILA